MSAVSYHLGSMGSVMLLSLPLLILFRTLWLMHKRQSPRWGHELLLWLLVLYLIGLASQTLTFSAVRLSNVQQLMEQAALRWETGQGINFTPGYTIRSMLEKGSRAQQLINLAGNVLIFVPLGFLPPLLWRRWRHFWTAVPLSAAVSCLIEFLQFFLNRSVDVDDLILNTLGGLLGYLLFCLLPQKLK